MGHGPEFRDSPTSRRAFLKGATALTAGAFVSPKFLDEVGLAPRSKNETIGIGVIGTGGMGGAHCDALIGLNNSKAENIAIRALADVCKPRLDARIEACTKAQGSPVEGYRDYRKLLERKDVDVVWVASPEHWHAQMTIDAVAAGKDVYVEKPMTLNLEDALRVLHLSKKTDRVIEVGTQYVTDPKYDKAREFIAAGKIGKPVTSETGYFRNSKIGEWNYYQIDPKVAPGEMLDWGAWCGPLGEAPFETKIYHRWRRYRRYSTGIVGDLLVHQMTPLIKCLDQGWPVRVVGIGGHYIDGAMENHDQVNILVQFEKGHTMTISGSTCNETGPAPIIRGHKGNIFLSGNACAVKPEKLFVDEVDPDDSFKQGGDSHDRLRLDFLKCSRTRATPLATVELGTMVMVIVDLATRSMWDGKTYTFDPATHKVSST